MQNSSYNSSTHKQGETRHRCNKIREDVDWGRATKDTTFICDKPVFVTDNHPFRTHARTHTRTHTHTHTCITLYHPCSCTGIPVQSKAPTNSIIFHGGGSKLFFAFLCELGQSNIGPSYRRGGGTKLVL